MTDRYLYSTSLSCLTDPLVKQKHRKSTFANIYNRSTNEYCDEIVAGWVSNGSEYTSAQNCSPCELGLQKLQLESPFGYSDESAEAFSSLISSCSATGYTFATPTTYALNATATSATRPTCLTSSYSVQADDTCVTISAANNVSTYNLISENALDVACNGISQRKTLCLPETCTTHQLEFADTCDSLVSDFNITFAQLLAWNPNINIGCSNLASWRGWYLCAR